MLPPIPIFKWLLARYIFVVVVGHWTTMFMLFEHDNLPSNIVVTIEIYSTFWFE